MSGQNQGEFFPVCRTDVMPKLTKVSKTECLREKLNVAQNIPCVRPP